MLIAAKAIAERTTMAIHWTDELCPMLQISGFGVISIDPGSPKLIVAERAAF